MTPGERRLLEIGGKRSLTSADFPTPVERGPNGRKLCCWCHQEVPPRRYRFCSDACFREYGELVIPQRRNRLVYRRDQGKCQLCGAAPKYGDWEVDHIKPVIEGGSNHPSNLRVLCTTCHKAETGKLRKRLLGAEQDRVCRGEWRRELAKLEEYKIIRADPARAQEAIHWAMKHALNCFDGINDPCGECYIYVDCPICEELKREYGVGN